MGTPGAIARQTISIGRERTLVRRLSRAARDPEPRPGHVRPRRRAGPRHGRRRHLRGARLRPRPPRRAAAGRSGRGRRPDLRLRRARWDDGQDPHRLRSAADARRVRRTRPIRPSPRPGARRSRPGEQVVITWDVTHDARERRRAGPRRRSRTSPIPRRSTPPGMPRPWRIETDHEVVNHVLRRSMDDLCLLRRRRRPARRSSRPVCPWFATLFGATRSSPRSSAWPSRRASRSRRSRSSPRTRRPRSTRGATPSLARSSTSSGPAR